MSKITVLTVVPRDLAADLANKQRVSNYNNLPQVANEALEVIKEYIADNIGYSDLPIACLGQSYSSGKLEIKQDFTEYLPTNSKDSVVFILEMPEDMVVSVDFKKLLEFSNAIRSSSDDEEEVEIFKEDLKEELMLGFDPAKRDNISFIPFLDYKRCKFYSTLDENFKPDQSLNLANIKGVDLRELATFYN